MPQSGFLPLHQKIYFQYLLPILLLPILTGLVFYQAIGFDFCLIDDNAYVTGNRHVLEGFTYDSVRWAFLNLHANFYHPLTTLSHMLDVQIYGLNPSGHHLTNILLHAVNSCLLFTCLFRLTGHYPEALLVSALFSVHPLHVESVVWISQRKDLLSGLFFFLCLLAYARYTKTFRGREYALLCILFLLGLLSKPIIVTLPFLFLLLDIWPLNRLAQDSGKQETLFSIVIEKIPLFFIAALFSGIAFFAQNRGGAVGDSLVYPLIVRLKNALVSYVLYMKKTLYPADLTLFYPHPANTISLIQLTLSAFLLILLMLWALSVRKRSGAFLVGWLWFLGMLVPVSGVIQVGSHGMADRYTYLSVIGLFIMFAEGGRGLKIPGSVAARILLSAVLVLLLSLLAWKQTGFWRDNETLLLHAEDVTENNILASQGLGTIYLKRGEYEKSEKYFRQVLRLNPDYIKALNGLGTLFFERGELNRALFSFEKALGINNKYEEAHNNLANVLSGLKRYSEAILHYQEVLRADPMKGETHLNIGKTYSDMGDFKRAVFHLEKASQIVPDSAEAHMSLGVAYYNSARLRRAIEEFEVVLKLDPAQSEAHYNLAIAYGDLGENERSFSEMQKAMKASKK